MKLRCAEREREKEQAEEAWSQPRGWRVAAEQRKKARLDQSAVEEKTWFVHISQCFGLLHGSSDIYKAIMKHECRITRAWLDLRPGIYICAINF